jgi:uncharacterized protein YdhG (YjbR/CyaY superfamily)
VDAYLAALPEVQRAPLEALRAAIRAEAPEAIEGIAYQMPAFYANGRLLVSYAAFRHHLSLFPASGAVTAKLGAVLRRHLSGKGTIKFTPDDPLSDDLVRQIVRIRRDELAGTADRSA